MTASLRVLIVDDEPLARRGVRARLQRYAGVEVVAEAASGKQAVRAITTLGPDLVFLDVTMPEGGAFSVVESVGADRMPVTIFLTAFDEYAIKAFDAGAQDYLLKPIDDERFGVALERAWQRVLERRTRERGEPMRILIADRRRVLLLEPQEIEWVDADGDYLRIHTADGTHLIRETMKDMAGRLPAERFVRIHRSTIVNAGVVRELIPRPNREYVVVLKSGARLKSSRSYREQTEQLLRDAR